MNAINIFLDSAPWLRLVFDIFSVVIPLSALLAFVGIGFMSAAAKIFFIKNKGASYDKCARQLASLGLVLGWLLLIGGRVWLTLTQITHKMSQAEASLLTFTTELCWILLCASVLLISLYYSLWKPLSKYPVAHAILCILGGLQGCVAVMAILAESRYLTVLLDQGEPPVLQNLFMPGWESLFWSALCCTPLLIAAMPGAFGALWLAFRRKHEDFGRDYYKTMIAWCAAWARNAWTLLWIFLFVSSVIQIYLRWQPTGFDVQDAVIQTGALLLWLMPILIWTIVQRSKTPLQHKIALTVALLIAVAFMLPYYLGITEFTLATP